jgi:hypothetical protein
LQRWAGPEQLGVLLKPWLKDRNAEIQRMIARLLQKEEWTEPASSLKHIPGTPMELQRVCAAAINTVLEMNLPTAGIVMRSQLELVSSLVHSFIAAVSRGCDNPAMLIRPAPPLTRFKEKLARKAEAGTQFDGYALVWRRPAAA